MAIIFGILALVITLALLPYVFKILGAILVIPALILFGPAFLMGAIIERVTFYARSQLPTAVLMVSGLIIVTVKIYLNASNSPFHSEGFSHFRNYLTAALAIIACIGIYKTRSLKKINSNLEILKSRNKRDLIIYHGSLFLAAASILSPFVLKDISVLMRYEPWMSGAYWSISILSQCYLLVDIFGRISFCKNATEDLSKRNSVKVNAHYQELAEKHIQNDDDSFSLYEGAIVHLVDTGVIREYELSSSRVIFNAVWDDSNRKELKILLASSSQWSVTEVVNAIIEKYKLDKTSAQEFLEHHADLGTIYGLGEDKFFVSSQRVDEYRICTCCGHADKAANDPSLEWFCSDICSKTEGICQDIKRQDTNSFLSAASSSGFILMAGAHAYNQNYKMFAAGGQGHGYAAELANHKIDKVLMKDAKLVGGDNAKNGADRIIDGSKIQTKYCKTAARSIGAGFDGKTGDYRYIDADGKPMQIEVPKDQYDAAVKHMEEKIRNGKVPGITDPSEAKKLVVKGHITYEQAKNITKFGTVESVTYDLAEGAVVGLMAGGISFAISASIYYLSTKDAKKALKVAAIQGGKVFGKTLIVYTGAQQLHRVAAIQNALKHIDIRSLSSSKISLLKKGFGINSTKGVNKALRGNLVTSVVLIAVTTGPDMVKLTRGRISKAQFTKNLAVTSSGVIGGLVGSIVGGVMLPFGGQIIGGLLGGTMASMATNKLAGKLMIEDREKILILIQHQIEYLAITFLLTEDEIINLSSNIEKTLTPKTLEIIHAGGSHQRAMANFFLMPVVVSIIKQRPQLHYDSNDILSACEEIAA